MEDLLGIGNTNSKTDDRRRLCALAEEFVVPKEKVEFVEFT